MDTLIQSHGDAKEAGGASRGIDAIWTTYQEAHRRGCTVKVVGDYAWRSPRNRHRWVRLVGSRIESGVMEVTVAFQSARNAGVVRYTVEGERRPRQPNEW
jgi:hypothetical protein